MVFVSCVEGCSVIKSVITVKYCIRQSSKFWWFFSVDFSTVRRYDLEFLPLIIRYEVSKIKGRTDSEIAFLFWHCNIPSAIGLIKTSAILEHKTKFWYIINKLGPFVLKRSDENTTNGDHVQIKTLKYNWNDWNRTRNRLPLDDFDCLVNFICVSL